MPNQVAKVTQSRHSNKRFFPLIAAAFLTFALITFLPSTLGSLAMAFAKTPHPKVILISLDGGARFLANKYLDTGVLSQDLGLGLLKNKGVVAQQNLTCTPSLTAACHISIATGSTTAKTDIPTNSFELVASPISNTISGFAAPIGGYSVTGPAPSPAPTAEPIWIGLRASGKKVVAATFPGADGADITVPGRTNLVQSADKRTVDYTVPFGAFAGVSAQGFSLTAADFSAAPKTIIQQLKAARKKSYSPVLQKTTALENFTVGGVNYTIQVAALDTSNDHIVNYDTLVFFDTNNGIAEGPFRLPSTGPAYVRAADKRSSPFYLEGSSNKAGTGFYVSNLAPDLSTVRIIRYGANSIPRNSAVISNVDDINNNVGFWSYQADYRITERLSPGLATFPDIELEESYEDQVRTFVDYQTRVALRAISQVPDADLALIYIEQPDGSEHQFLITDPRQATNPTDPTSINNGQDPKKIARYQKYVETAYKVANKAVERIIKAVGTDRNGRPKSNIIVTSDHGFATFHTSVDINSLLRSNGIDLNKVRAVTSGPAVNVYINLQGRELGGTVSRQEYVTLQKQIVDVLQAFVETNPNYTLGEDSVSVFDKVYPRPIPDDLNDPSFGIGTNDIIGQDAGDVLALLTEGYNFDGIQSPVVARLGDDPSSTPVLSVSNFYGAHGYDATIPNMSSIFFAAGPDIQPGTIDQVSNIDLVPTINRLLGVDSAPTVQGNAIDLSGTS
ncbi:MAG: alkaline phosphatase family protein [Stigonema ocellatum SAG 48.90 = DSM 106950]|nr:alkaline phosphatase family protein [Stigonema ocellatum SAG 48.90 = DSM 106950]